MSPIGCDYGGDSTRRAPAAYVIKHEKHADVLLSHGISRNLHQRDAMCEPASTGDAEAIQQFSPGIIMNAPQIVWEIVSK